MTYMAFVMSGAAEIMLENTFTDNNFTSDDLRYEEKMYYKIFVDGLNKMRRGIAGFNQKTIDKYFEFGKSGETDKIRKNANDLIRLFCYSRNSIATEQDSIKYEEQLKEMQFTGNKTISQETIDKFRMQ